MSLLQLITEAGGSSAIGQIGARVGLSPEQTQAAMAALMPALAGGLRQQVRDGGISGPLAAAPAPDDTNALAADGAVSQGNDILGQIFGSKDVSRSVAADAAERTGIDAGSLKALLPLLASLLAGTVASRAGSGSGGLDGLLGMLDQDGDGNPLNDIIGMAGRLFGR